MLHTIRAVRPYPPTSFPRSLSSNLGRWETSAVRFSTHPDRAQDMDKTHDPSEEPTNHGDVMSHSFGEGYATRSDEEGFGGIYGGKQSLSKTQTDKSIHENHPAYDKTQGSEVKEKEKGRHQPSTNA